MPSSNIGVQVRLFSGLVLMVFVAGHLVNHALTLHSLEAVAAGRRAFTAIWRSGPGTILLYGALIAHVTMTLWRLFQRRRLRMPIWEAVQILLGLAIPFWLAVHIIGTRGIHQAFGVDDTYLLQFAGVWQGGAGRQTTMLLLVWLHGCVGLHFWLRIRPWYARLRPSLLIVALLLPSLALAGFHLGGREVQAMIALDPDWIDRVAAAQRWLDEEDRAWIYQQEGWVLNGFVAVLALITLGRLVRHFMERSAGKVRIRYLDGNSVTIDPGMTVLEGSRAAGVPHASVCGGRGRCSTCRVRLGDGAEHVAPPGDDEARVLKRIGATESIRLACQVRPIKDLEVTPLLPAGAEPMASQARVDPGTGVEREIAVLFADLRAFTRMSEGRLPYDVVFILNQYFKAMGSAIEGAGGRVDKFIGDGIMALFGIDAEPERACQQALIAAKAMSVELEELNRQIAADLPEPLRIGIGLHVGPVILGEMGYRQATTLTAIGDTVNVASRLETLTKEYGAQLVVSARLAKRAGVDLSAFETSDVDIRGRKRPLQVHVVEDAKSMLVADDSDGAKKASVFSIARLLGRSAFGRERV